MHDLNLMGEKCGTPLRPYSSDSVKTTGLLPDVVSPLCRSPQSHMMGPWELREGCKWRRRAKRECCQVEAMSLLLSSLLSSPLSSALLCSATAFSLLGEIITRHQAPGPDIHRSEKQRERARQRERERERERARKPWSDATGEGKATQTTVSCLGSPVSCTDGPRRGLVADIFPLDLGS